MNHNRSAAARSQINNGEAAARGVKRQADDSLDDEQRFAKRFNLLTLGQKSNLYIPVPATSTNEPLRSDGETRGIGRAGNGDGAARRDEFMHVDDAPDRIYIHDLDAELADIEAEEGGLVYLPDIERKISKIPKHVLMGGASKDRDTSHELVLYRPPMSFLAPTGLQDATRESETSGDNTGKDAAVGSARQQSPYADHEPETAHGLSAADYDLEELDEDAMDTS